MIRTTTAHRTAVRGDLIPQIRWHREKVWTYLVADILDRALDQAPYLNLLCGQTAAQRLEP